MDDIEGFLDYFDETRVQLRFVDMPDEAPARVWLADFMTVDQSNPRDDVVRDIERALVHHGPPIPHTLDIRRSHYDWGASAATQEVVVQVANHAIDEGWDVAIEMGKLVVGAGLKLLWDKWRARGRANRDFELLMGAEQAEAAARERVHRVYGLSEDPLALVADSHAPGDNRWTFTFGHPQATYSVTLSVEGEDVITAEITRTVKTPR